MEQLRRWWRQDWCFWFLFGLLKLGIHLTAIKGYGFFRDEFYYLACGEHLAFGYVDHPPLVALLTKLVRVGLGESIYAIRLLPISAGIAVVCLTGYLARELGAKRFGQALAMTAVLVAPIYLGIHGFLSMNAFDHVFWGWSCLLLTRIIKHDNPRLWIPFGLVVGFGLENKISLLFLGFGVFVGLVLTPERRFFKDYRLWLAGGLAGLLFLPHVIWQQLHGWPTLEFMRNAQAYKHYAYKPWEFLWGALLEANPFSLPLLAGGLFFYFVSRNGKSFRLLGWAFVSILGLFLVQKAKTYYLAPALPLLFAAGGTMMEIWVHETRWIWLQPACLVWLVTGGILVAPLALPILPETQFIAYAQRLGIQGVKSENHKMGKLPQHFADMHGWEELATTVGQVYQSLSPAEQLECGIYAQNYGEAGAIDFFGKKYGLPPAISGHNNYYLWGPGKRSNQVLIIVGGKKERHEQVFAQVEQAGTVVSEYSMPYENNLPVYIARQPKLDLKSVWSRVKHFD